MFPPRPPGTNPGDKEHPLRAPHFGQQARNANFLARGITWGRQVADSEHIEILHRGPRAWNAWRQDNPSLIPNLDDAALSLSERQLGPINGGPINLRSASMQRAFLWSANLSACNLEAADLSGANLAYARLDRANLKAANLKGAVLDYADFNGAVLADANLSGASLQHAQNLTQAQINDSTCDAATILPAHLEHPTSRLEVVREARTGELIKGAFVSKIV
jgi:Pentapeptide repeats (8 copies)